ncbi:SDR family oxidoreductase [Microvirga mediterraneensis]|uniref:SDR family oxidoreductase n=1 Tax=Microvirga mediterraneensis TaxID=2754695 RepID=A0A838BSH6_9HYPH|nr:SDR family oxidoreductase [Microvirga mediterraneensis]MBA1158764.1 SDR family oxidoreductase [Microvirga mediterraneensis]
MTRFDPFSDFRMDGHVALVTGGAQNIGEAIARTFAGAGARVMIADLDGKKAQAAAAVIAEESGSDVRGVACDVTVEADIRACVDETVMAFGGVSTLVNNVGWGRAYDDPLAVSDEDMIQSYRLNTLSAMRMAAACRPHLLRAENATITNSGSLVGIQPAFDFIAYSAAKAALNHLMLGLAHYLAREVRINTVLIGTVLTEGYAAAGLDEKAQHALAHPDNLTGRAGTPQDVANAFLWLASRAGSWVSGQTIQVHGGGRRIRLKPE